jgi:hypothetical protein
MRTEPIERSTMLTTQQPAGLLAAAPRASATAPILGSAGDTLMKLDLGRLLSTRLLIQAASNGGKSWALRRILEQTHGRVQQLVIDPEGELVTLAERYDYLVCAPEGGDARLTPDNGTAVARTIYLSGRLAILAINDLGLEEMRRFVGDFLRGLLAIPKDSWHFAVAAIDEAQLFAPQHDKAESKKPMIDLATRGRKRGLGSVFATQRIAMLNKGVVSQLVNKLIGLTTLDIDVARAADELGMSARHARELLGKVATGEFYAYGPALSHDLIKVRIGPVQTRHGVLGSFEDSTPTATCSKEDLIAALELTISSVEEKQDCDGWGDDETQAPDCDDAGMRRYRAIRPFLDPRKRGKAALEWRAKQLDVGLSTLYRWLQRYDPKIGPKSLAGSRKRCVAVATREKPAKAGGKIATGRKSADATAVEIKANYWLSVETPDNWIADKVTGFSLMGIADRKKALAQTVEAGDLILTYVKGRGFADIRRVVTKGLVALRGPRSLHRWLVSLCNRDGGGAGPAIRRPHPG